MSANSESQMLSEIQKMIVDLEISGIGNVVRKTLDGNISPTKVLGALKAGMREVGKKFQEGHYFLSDLIMAGETMNEAIKVLEPHLRLVKTKNQGRIVLGTVLGDLHDIGKNVVKIYLISMGFEVFDLGIDVPPEKFAEKAKEIGADIVGVSALLSVTVPTSAKVVQALKRIGLRDQVKVILGGAAVRKWAVEKFGVDAAVNDVIEGTNIIRSWMEEE